MTWQQRVKALLERYGSREALAVALGVSYFTVMRWEVGRFAPDRRSQGAIERLEVVEAESKE